jgi:phosphatidylserine decarboxylase
MIQPRFAKIRYRRVPSVYYIERTTGLLKKEKVPAERWLKWLYHDPLGNLVLEAIIKRKALSKMYGRFMDSPNSAGKIRSFIEIFNINMKECEKSLSEFTTFNDFFTRKLKPDARIIDNKPESLVSPADGKILAYNNLTLDQHFIIKGYDFSLSEFLNNDDLARQYEHGSMIVVRLTPADYHRFHFPLDGVPAHSKLIKGKYYSVSPISVRKKLKIFYKNKREYTVISTKLFGDVVMVEVGATLVGCIKQTYKPEHSAVKGKEKGYFKFGGSSVVLLFKQNVVRIDEDLLHNSQLGYETVVKMGERIGSHKPIE